MTITRLIEKYNLVKYTGKSDPDTTYYTFPSSIPIDGYTMKICHGELFMAEFISIVNDDSITHLYWTTPARPGEHIRKLHKQLLECTKKLKLMQIKRKIIELKEDFV